MATIMEARDYKAGMRFRVIKAGGRLQYSRRRCTVRYNLWKREGGGMAGDDRTVALEALSRGLLQVLDDHQPQIDEMAAMEIELKQGPSGEPRAYIGITDGQHPTVLSRATWEFMMPDLLRMIYGARVAEAGVIQAIASQRRKGAVTPDVFEGIMGYYRNMVVAPHPLEMQRVRNEQTLEEARAERDGGDTVSVERRVIEMRDKLRRGKGDRRR